MTDNTSSANGGGARNRASKHAPYPKAESYIQRLLELVNDLVFSISVDAKRVLYLNPAAETIYGRKIEALTAQQELWIDCIHEKDRDKFRQSVLGINETKRFSLEFRVVQPDGSIRYLQGDFRRITDDEGTLAAIGCIAKDVTNRVRTEFELEESKAIYHSLVESLPVNIFRKDRDGRIVFVNSKYCETVGKPFETLIGKTDYDLFDPKLAEKYQKDDKWVLQTGLPFHDIEFHQQEDDEYIYVEVLKAPVTAAGGRRIGIQGMFWDVTDRKKAEIELEKAKDIAVAASQAKSDFLANVSHEIRTPLNAVIGMTDLLLSSRTDKSQKEYLGMIQDSGQSLLTLINDILDFSKIESGKLEIDTEWFDLRERMGDTLRTLAFRAHGKTLDLICNIDPEIPIQILGDAQRLRQIIVNLVGNSIKFTDSGEVSVDVERVAIDDDEITLKFLIQDSGIGIPEEKLSEIFNEFIQADTSTTRKYGGTGLGLAIASNLVELMGGELHVNSKIDVGSQFHFTLKFPIANQPLQPAIPDDFNNIPILLMAKNPNLVNSLDCVLNSWRMKTYCVRDNEQAVKLAKGMSFASDPIQVVLAEANFDDDLIDEDCDCSTLARQIFADTEVENPAFIALVKSSTPKGLDIADESPETRRILLPAKYSELRDAIAHCLNPLSESLTGEEIIQASFRGPYRILLAEDNPVNQKLAVGILQKYDHQITVVGNGQLAVDALKGNGAENFDLVLMDVQMPELDGIAATKAIRDSNTSGSTLPIIAMTAHAMASDRKRCLEAGMDDFLSKPFRAQDLVATIDRLMESRSRELAETTVHKIGNSSGIDWNVAFDTVGGDRNLLIELINIFVAEKDSMIQRIREGFVKSDLESAQRVAHSMKGTLHHLGASKVAQIAEDIERLGEDELERAVTLTDKLENGINQLTSEFQRFTNN